jgi:hypothetical protein
LTASADLLSLVGIVFGIRLLFNVEREETREGCGSTGETQSSVLR